MKTMTVLRIETMLLLRSKEILRDSLLLVRNTIVSCPDYHLTFTTLERLLRFK